MKLEIDSKIDTTTDLTETLKSFIDALEYPWDGDDDGNTGRPEDWALLTTRTIIAHLLAKGKGFQELFDSVDDDVTRMVLVDELADIIRVGEATRWVK